MGLQNDLNLSWRPGGALLYLTGNVHFADVCDIPSTDFHKDKTGAKDTSGNGGTTNEWGIVRTKTVSRKGLMV